MFCTHLNYKLNLSISFSFNCACVAKPLAGQTVQTWHSLACAVKTEGETVRVWGGLSLSHWERDLCADDGCSVVVWMWQWFCYGFRWIWHIIVISFSLGQPCFERNAFSESENCNHCMFIATVSCFYWSTRAQYIITWTCWSNQMCSGRKNNINVQFEGCYFEIMALRIWVRELNVLHSNVNLRFMSQSILSSLFRPIVNAIGIKIYNVELTL